MLSIAGPVARSRGVARPPTCRSFAIFGPGSCPPIWGGPSDFSVSCGRRRSPRLGSQRDVGEPSVQPVPSEPIRVELGTVTRFVASDCYANRYWSSPQSRCSMDAVPPATRAVQPSCHLAPAELLHLRPSSHVRPRLSHLAVPHDLIAPSPLEPRQSSLLRPRLEHPVLPQLRRRQTQLMGH